MNALRVLHVPGRTPYARKIRSERFRIVNETVTPQGLAVPRDASLQWLLAHRPWHEFDVLHIHHVEFESPETLALALRETRKAGKRVVYTAHDVAPVFGDPAAHLARHEILAGNGVPFVALTEASGRDLRAALGGSLDLTTIPHGFVIRPERASRYRAAGRSTTRTPTRFIVYGSARQNRDIESVLHCWRFARRLRDTTLHLLLRAPSRAGLAAEGAAWQAIREHAADPRLLVDVLPFPTDDEVAEAVAAAHCLVLPYRWASHSGQMELGFDLGVRVAASRTGYLADQAGMHAGLVDEPTWFDWDDGAEFAYGERLLAAMEQAHDVVQRNGGTAGRAAFAGARREEHDRVLASYQRLYETPPE